MITTLPGSPDRDAAGSTTGVSAELVARPFERPRSQKKICSVPLIYSPGFPGAFRSLGLPFTSRTASALGDDGITDAALQEVAGAARAEDSNVLNAVVVPVEALDGCAPVCRRARPRARLRPTRSRDPTSSASRGARGGSPPQARASSESHRGATLARRTLPNAGPGQPQRRTVLAVFETTAWPRTYQVNFVRAFIPRSRTLS
jgi:hypothetical protein